MAVSVKRIFTWMYSNVLERIDQVCYIIIIYEPRYLKRDQCIHDYTYIEIGRIVYGIFQLIPER